MTNPYRRPKGRSRKQRWQRSGSVGFVIFVALSAAAFGGIDGAGGIVIGIFFAVMALLEARDRQRGWRISYDLPAHGLRQIERGGLGGEVARQAWEATQKEAMKPNRKRYAFEKDGDDE